MPTSSDFRTSWVSSSAPMTPPAAPEVRHRDDLGEAAVGRAQRRGAVEAEPAEPEDEHAEAEQRHVVAGDRPRLAVGAVLALARPEEGSARQRGGAPVRCTTDEPAKSCTPSPIQRSAVNRPPPKPQWAISG
jgi:hypothetical protein